VRHSEDHPHQHAFGRDIQGKRADVGGIDASLELATYVTCHLPLIVGPAPITSTVGAGDGATEVSPFPQATAISAAHKTR
jgi:hypothetical protein